MASMYKVLEALNVSGFDVIGDPATEQEFLSAVRKHDGVDENNVRKTKAISAVSELGTTWGAIAAKMAELDAAAPLEALRVRRNKLLAATDWWAVADRTMTPEQSAYRQALRDITDTYTSLDDVVWPVKPE